MDVPWKRALKTKSQRQEERIARQEGGSKQINSGRTAWTSKRDNVIARTYRFLVEARTTDKASYRINKKEFQDLTREAVKTPPGLLPMMRLDIQELQVSVVRNRDIDEMMAHVVDLEEQLAGKQTD